MFGMGVPELIVIAAIATFLFGAKKLPEVASGLGKAIKSFRKEMKEVVSGLDTVEHQGK